MPSVRAFLHRAPKSAWVAAATALLLELWYFAHTVAVWSWEAIPTDPGKHVFHLFIFPAVLWLEILFLFGQRDPSAMRKRHTSRVAACLALVLGVGVAAAQAIQSFPSDQPRDFLYPSDIAACPIPEEFRVLLGKLPASGGDPSARAALPEVFGEQGLLEPVQASLRLRHESGRDLLADLSSRLGEWTRDPNVAREEQLRRRRVSSGAYRAVSRGVIGTLGYFEASGVGGWLGPFLSGLGLGAAFVGTVMVGLVFIASVRRRVGSAGVDAAATSTARWDLAITAAVALLLSSWIPLRYMSSQLLAYGPEMPTIGLALGLLMASGGVLALGWGLSAAERWQKAVGLIFAPVAEFAAIFAFISIDGVGAWLATLFWPETILVTAVVLLVGFAVVATALAALLARDEQKEKISKPRPATKTESPTAPDAGRTPEGRSAVTRQRLPAIRVADDPQKGRFGGEAERNGRRLSASVKPVRGSGGWYDVELEVASTEESRPLAGKVVFYLHDSSPTSVEHVPVVDGRAVHEVRAEEAFTVGAVTDDGETRLELDLSKDPKFPRGFRGS